MGGAQHPPITGVAWVMRPRIGIVRNAAKKPYLIAAIFTLLAMYSLNLLGTSLLRLSDT